MQILMNTGGLAMTNAFLIADENAKQAVLFDAPDHTVLPLLEQARSNGWDVVGLWLTHGHFDHIADHAVVTQQFPSARVLIHKLDEHKLTSPGTKMFQLPFTIPPRTPDALIEDDQVLHFGDIEVRVLHTPGHSPGHVMFHLPQHEVLVGGDLIIGGSIGRTDLPDASYEDLQASIRRVMKLPPATRLLPGHGDVSTLGEEMRDNPYVREALVADRAAR